MTELPDALQTWIDRKRDDAKSENTAAIWANNVRQYYQWIEETGREFPTEGDDLQQTHAKLVDWFLRNQKSEGYKRSTIENRHKTLKKLYDDFSSHFLFQIMEETPFEIIDEKSTYLPPRDREEEKRRRVYVTKEEKEQLKENVGSPRFRNELIIELMWQTGLRQGEIVNLKLENVGEEYDRLNDIWRPKVENHHTTSIVPPADSMLETYVKKKRAASPYAEESDYLFPTRKGAKPGRQLPNDIIQEAAENAGIQRRLGEDMKGNTRWAITSHALRRGHGMHLWRDGVDLHTIRGSLGHTKVSQTQEYLPIDDDDIEEKIAGVNW